ncbi:MAG: S41 family peptidase [Pseudomonadota bacterium]
MPGRFDAAETFVDQCEAPRSGVDIEGNTFPDEQGTLLEELFWLRSWTNETYLWNEEVPDQDPNDFSDRLAYFAELRTFEITRSGEDKDDFHFSEPTSEYLARRNSAGSAGYGASIAALSRSVPRDFRIRYTDPGTPAAEEVSGQINLVRGARILEVDGVDLINATSQADIDTLNAGLFPATPGETHVFTIQDPGASDSRTITLVSGNVSTKPVNRVSVIDTATGPVGYLLFNTFSPFAAEEELADAFNELSRAGVSDLVLDLRYNGGGLLAVASQLGYQIAGRAQTQGRTFEALRYNTGIGGTSPVTGQPNDPIPFYDSGLGFTLPNGAPLSSLDLPRVFVLTTERTCSASEAVINGLRGVDVEVVVIGDVTCGKPFGFFPTDNCGETYYTIQFQGVNDKGFGDYADGFVPQDSDFEFGVQVPGCTVADDLTRELGDENEALLAAALQFREDGTCPAAPQTTSSFEIRRLTDGATDVATTAITPAEDIFLTNRDMTMPY